MKPKGHCTETHLDEKDNVNVIWMEEQRRNIAHTTSCVCVPLADKSHTCRNVADDG